MDVSPYIDLLQGEYGREILQFNFSPLNWVHKSWHANLGVKALKQWVVNSSSKRSAQAILLVKMELLSDYDFDFSATGSRISLLSCVQLEMLAFYMGMLRYTEFFESQNFQLDLINKNYQEKFKHFIRYVAPYLLEEESFEDIYIDCGDITDDPPQIEKKTLFMEGSNLLAALINEESDAIKKRFYYKMPRGSVNFDTASIPIEYNSMLKMITKINYLISDDDEILLDRSFQKIRIHPEQYQNTDDSMESDNGQLEDIPYIE